MTEETIPGVSPSAIADLNRSVRAWREGQPGARPAEQTTRTPAQIALIYERGRNRRSMGFYEDALRIMGNVTLLAPDHANAWRDYAALLRHAGRDLAAEKAEARAAAAAPADIWPLARGEQDPAELRRLDEELQERLFEIPEEERASWLRDRIGENPLDVAALRYLAEEEERDGDVMIACNILRRALELSPAYLGARAVYAKMLADQRDYMTAYYESAHLLAAAPDDFEYRLLRADAAIQVERFDEAKALYAKLLQEYPQNLAVLRSYGGLMKTVGNRDEAASTYRTLLAHYPNVGAAYYGLNQLRANYLTGDDVEQMRRRLDAGISAISSRRNMAYALAQTLESMGQYEASFQAYQFAADVSGEIVKGTSQEYDPAAFAHRLDRFKHTFTASAIAERAVTPPANPATTPIFIIGMPRAGSTLVEQILASHDQVEATRELPVVSEITRRIAQSRLIVTPDAYPDRVLEYSRAELDELGVDVLDAIAEFRSTTLPYVIDKRPWN